MKMASVEKKRRHVMTKRMQEYLRMKHPHEGRDDGDDNGGQRLLHCPHTGCEKVLTSTPGLRYHIRTHEMKDGSAYSCSKCKKHFRSYNGLRYHTQRTKCESSGSDGDTEEESLSACGSPIKLEHGNHIMELDCYRDAVSSFSPLDTPVSYNCTVQKESMHCSESLSDSDVEEMASSTIGGTDFDDQHNWLRELAIIATGPQSPLLRESKSQPKHETVRMTNHMEDCLHSYARPPPRSRSPSPPPTLIRPNPRKQRHQSEPSSRVAEDLICLADPTPYWLIFLRGSRLHLESTDRTNLMWHCVEDFKEHINSLDASYGEDGLRLVELMKSPVCVYTYTSVEEVHMRFTTGKPGQPDIWACCPTEHPFFVKDKGWSSAQPELTRLSYGVSCAQLEVSDMCLPSSHPLTTLSSEVLNSLNSYDLSAMDSSAVLMLSNMAKQKKEQESLSPPASPARVVSRKQEQKAKRPMNAFMLFAKRFRMEYMHQHPGKDNRAISVLLGDTWKKMGADERKTYTQEAKLLADQQKKLHPDCWKRKRSVSTGALER